MSRPRLLADHDSNEHIIVGVLRREPSLEFVCVRDVGLRDRPDSEVLAFAAENGLLIVSHDFNTMPVCAYARLAAKSSNYEKKWFCLARVFDKRFRPRPFRTDDFSCQTGAAETAAAC